MIISPVRLNNNFNILHNKTKQNRQIAFKSNTVKVDAKEPFLQRANYRTMTCLLRGSLKGDKRWRLGQYEFDWDWWKTYLNNHFTDKDINIYNMACSDGSEAYSHAIAWLEGKKENKNPNQKLRVYASDINKTLIDIANSRKINLDDMDIQRLDYYTDSKSAQYFDLLSNNEIDIEDIMQQQNPQSHAYTDIDYFIDPMTYTPSKKLQEIVSFENIDMLSQLEKIKDDGNSVVSCSNVFLYLTNDYADKFIKLLFKKLKPGSVFKVGQADLRDGFSPLCKYRSLYEYILTRAIPLNNYGTVFQII